MKMFNGRPVYSMLDLYEYVRIRILKHENLDMDGILDIILFAQKRIRRGDFITRVIAEAFVHIDDYLYFNNSFQEVSF